MCTSPVSADCARESSESSVDLPLPFGPSSAIFWRREIDRDNGGNRGFVKDFVRFVVHSTRSEREEEEEGEGVLGGVEDVDIVGA